MPREQDYRILRQADGLPPLTQTIVPLPIASRWQRRTWRRAVLHRPRLQSSAVKGCPFAIPTATRGEKIAPHLNQCLLWKAADDGGPRSAAARHIPFVGVPSWYCRLSSKPLDRPASDRKNPRPGAITWRRLQASGGAPLLLSRPSRPSRRMETQAIAPPPPPLHGSFSAATAFPHSSSRSKVCGKDEGGSGGGQQGGHVDVGDQRGAHGGDAGSGSMVSKRGLSTVRGLYGAFRFSKDVAGKAVGDRGEMTTRRLRQAWLARESFYRSVDQLWLRADGLVEKHTWDGRWTVDDTLCGTLRL